MNINTIIDDKEIVVFKDNYFKKGYTKVLCPQKETIEKFDYIIISLFDRQDYIYELLLKFKVKVIRLYESSEECAFYMYKESTDTYESIVNKDNNEPLKILNLKKLDERKLEILKRLNKVNKIINRIPDEKRVLVYAAAEHTEYLLKYSDLCNKNVVALMDRKVR